MNSDIINISSVPGSSLVESWEPLGEALMDYYSGNKLATIYIKSTIEADRAVPVEAFFREEGEFPPLEKFALKHCRGTILDAGAGAGPHAMILQKKGFDVTCLDISTEAVEVMKKRGLKKVFCSSIFDFKTGKYDTILMMMNGIGFAGDLKKVSELFIHLKGLLIPGGQLLFDSTDINYVSEYDRANSTLRVPKPDYYGITWYQLEYKGRLGKMYPWIFLDKNRLNQIADEAGFECRILKIKDSQYVASLILKK
jgi:SAM-dependent methyltransferase